MAWQFNYGSLITLNDVLVRLIVMNIIVILHSAIGKYIDPLLDYEFFKLLCGLIPKITGDFSVARV